MEDYQIIEAIKQGNEKAFHSLVDRYQQMVVNTSNSLVHSYNDAEDIAQDVFIEIFRKSSQFRGASSLKTWIYRITINRSLNFIRDNKKRSLLRKLEDLVSSGEQSRTVTRSIADNPVKKIENQQKAKIIHQAIDSLPEKQRIAFTLNKYEDLSYKEISEVMDMSLSAVEALIHRAKKNLQKKLWDCYKKNC